MSRRLLIACPIFLGLGLGRVAVGHDNATLDAMMAPHHGQLRMAGPYHLELVLTRAAGASKTRVTVYVTDHAGTPSVIEHAEGESRCTAGGTQSMVQLRQQAPNRFAGAGTVSSSPALMCTVTLKFPDGTVWSAEFTPAARGDHVSERH
jgi:hypothetical protein